VLLEKPLPGSQLAAGLDPPPPRGGGQWGALRPRRGPDRGVVCEATGAVVLCSFLSGHQALAAPPEPRGPWCPPVVDKTPQTKHLQMKFLPCDVIQDHPLFSGKARSTKEGNITHLMK